MTRQKGGHGILGMLRPNSDSRNGCLSATCSGERKPCSSPDPQWSRFVLRGRSWVGGNDASRSHDEPGPKARVDQWHRGFWWGPHPDDQACLRANERPVAPHSSDCVPILVRPRRPEQGGLMSEQGVRPYVLQSRITRIWCYSAGYQTHNKDVRHQRTGEPGIFPRHQAERKSRH